MVQMHFVQETRQLYLLMTLLSSMTNTNGRHSRYMQYHAEGYKRNSWIIFSSNNVPSKETC